MKTLKDLPLEEKRALYTSWIDELHDQKVEETRRKVARFGYTDEDDYHFLTPPEGYDWHPRGDTPNGDFHGYDGWSENYRDGAQLSAGGGAPKQHGGQLLSHFAKIPQTALA